MPQLVRPDGAKLHWHERGDGPALHVQHNALTATPSTFDALLTNLAADHRVVTWDSRGTGESTHDRPYDLETDAGDLTALIEDVGQRTVAIALGLATSPLVVAERRPELVAGIVLVGGVGGLGLSGETDPDTLLDSEPVNAAFLQLAKTDPRALQRSAIALGNPQLDDAGVRARLEAQLAYAPLDSWVERVESYLTYDASRACAALGNRLWLVHWANPLSPGRPMAHMRELLPDAHVIEVEDGPISRPDLTAAVIREVTATLRPG